MCVCMYMYKNAYVCTMYVSLSLYVCTYVGMYVSMYACMDVGM